MPKKLVIFLNTIMLRKFFVVENMLLCFEQNKII